MPAQVICICVIPACTCIRTELRLSSVSTLSMLVSWPRLVLSKTYHCIYSFTLQPSTYDDAYSHYYYKSGGMATATTDTHTLLRYVTVYMCKIGCMFVVYGNTTCSTINKVQVVCICTMTYMCSFVRHVYITSFFCH